MYIELTPLEAEQVNAAWAKDREERELASMAGRKPTNVKDRAQAILFARGYNHCRPLSINVEFLENGRIYELEYEY